MGKTTGNICQDSAASSRSEAPINPAALGLLTLSKRPGALGAAARAELQEKTLLRNSTKNTARV